LTLTFIIGVVAIAATIWVGLDSSKREWKTRGATALWVIGCLLLWIVVFPVYLYKRTTVPLKGEPPLPSSTGYEYRECPYCKEPMRRSAEVCPHCRNSSTPWRYHEGRWWFRNSEEGSWQWLDERTGTWLVHEPSAQSEFAPKPPGT